MRNILRQKIPTDPINLSYRNQASLYCVIEYINSESVVKTMVFEQGGMDKDSGRYKAKGKIICQ